MIEQDFHNALREYESQFPDLTAVRQGVATGVARRVRHRRLAMAASTAAAVAAVIGGVVVIMPNVKGHNDNATEQAGTAPASVSAPATPGDLVPATIPDLSFPVTPSPATIKDRVGAFAASTNGTLVAYNTVNPATGVKGFDFNLNVGPDRPSGGPEQPTTIAGHPAFLRTKPGSGRQSVFWQLPSGQWIEVDALQGLPRGRQVAEGLTNTPMTLHTRTRAGLTKRGMTATSQNGSVIGDPGQWGDNLGFCRDAAARDCFTVQPSPAPRITEVPVGPPTACKPSGKLNDLGKGEYEPVRQIGGASVRLSADHCRALKVLDQKRVIQILPQDTKLTTDELLHIAAATSIEP